MFYRKGPCVVGILLMSLASCQPQQCSMEEFAAVFDGFQFVGELSDGETIPLPVPSSEVLPFPRSMRRGGRYVFHSLGQVTTEQMAIVVLPTRLGAVHFSILDKPQSPDDFAVQNFGGPLWEIRFLKGECRGRLYNRTNRRLYESRRMWPPGSQDDYILEIQP